MTGCNNHLFVNNSRKVRFLNIRLKELQFYLKVMFTKGFTGKCLCSLSISTQSFLLATLVYKCQNIFYFFDKLF